MPTYKMSKINVHLDVSPNMQAYLMTNLIDLQLSYKSEVLQHDTLWCDVPFQL